MKFNKTKMLAIGGNILVRGGGAATGGVAGTLADKLPWFGGLRPLWRGLAKVVVGAAIPEFHNKPNDKLSLFLGSAGAGVAAIGGVDIVKDLAPAVISGPADIMSGITVDKDYKVEGTEEKVGEVVAGGDVVGRVDD